MRRPQPLRRPYFVRSGSVLTKHRAKDATHAVWTFFRQAVEAGRVDELGDTIGISRIGFEDEGMLFSLTPTNMPVNVTEPKYHDVDVRSLRRGSKKPPKNANARWRRKCIAEGRCPQCGKHHEGRLILCGICRERQNARQRKYDAAARRRKWAAGIGGNGRTAAPAPIASWIPVVNGWFYDPASPTIQEAEWAGIKREVQDARDYLPTPAEIKARAAAIRAKRVDAQGRPLPHVATSLAQVR